MEEMSISPVPFEILHVLAKLFLMADLILSNGFEEAFLVVEDSFPLSNRFFIVLLLLALNQHGLNVNL